MVKNMNGLKKFKVFYFLDGGHQGIDETMKWELIMARSEDEVERWFKIMYRIGLSDNKVSFGWVEEVVS
nr:MAG TPA: hypothetical protein [Caudoviricetes sp.]